MSLKPLTVEEVLALGVRTDEGCLLWPRTTNGLGYGRLRAKGKMWVVHRYVWTELRGPIPEGLTLDHLCHNRAAAEGRCLVAEGECQHRRCYELDHLELTTQRENWLRGRQGGAAIHRAKTHCPQGHPYDELNTLYTRGERHCRACAREKARRYRDKRRTLAGVER